MPAAADADDVNTDVRLKIDGFSSLISWNVHSMEMQITVPAIEEVNGCIFDQHCDWINQHTN